MTGTREEELKWETEEDMEQRWKQLPQLLVLQERTSVE